MNLNLLKYHPARFELIRGDEDQRLDFWEEIHQWETANEHNPEAIFTTNDASVAHSGIQSLKGAEDAMWGSYASFEKAGKNIFEFSPALVQMFLNSSVDAVPTSLIRMPFESVYFHFGQEAGVKSATTGLPIDGAYVRGWNGKALDMLGTPYVPWISDAAKWSFLKRVTKDHSEGFLDAFLGFDSGKTFGEILAAPFKNPHESQNEIEYWRQQRLIRGIADDLGKKYEIKNHREATAQWAPRPEEVLWQEQTRALTNLVVNALCYLSYEKREVEHTYPESAPPRLVAQSKSEKPTETRRAQSKLDALGYRKVYLCGRSVKAANPALIGGSLVAHWRRGHWRHQPCGHAMQDRKLMWIMPTLVNAEAGQIVHGHIYEAS